MNQGANIPAPGSTARTYEGGAFHPPFPNGRGSGKLVVGSLTIRFSGKAGELELPLAGLNISLGGASDRIVFFKHPSLPDSTLHTADHAILKEAAFAEHPELAAQIGKVHGRKRINLTVWLVLLGIIAALVGGVMAARDPMVNAVVKRIPPEWEVKMGDTAFQAITAQTPPLEDEVLQQQLDALTAPLLRGIGQQPYPFHFHIVENNTINAFALPGGQVVIHSELILKAKSPEEVAGVLAHEIAHVTKRHSVRNVVKSTGTYLLFRYLLGNVRDLVGTLTANARYLLNQKYSRDYEREADATGWSYLVAADVDPHGMISFFETLAKEQADNPLAAVQETLDFTSTHPATRERIARLEELAKALPKGKKYQGFDLNFEDFQNNLRAKLRAGKKAGENHQPGGKQ